jgi:hypothetical protein
MRSRLRRRLLVLLLLVLAIAGLSLARSAARTAVARKIRHLAGAHGLVASWRSLSLESATRVRVLGLVLAHAGDDTVLGVDSLTAVLDPASLATLRPEIGRLDVAHADLRWSPPEAAADTLVPEEPERAPATSPRLERLRQGAETVTRLLLAPARRLPRLSRRDVTVTRPGGDEAIVSGARIDRLELDPGAAGVRLHVAGSLAMEHEVPFDVRLVYGRDDRLAGMATLAIPDSNGSEPLRIAVQGALQQDRRAGVLRLADSTRVTLGRLPLTLGGSLDRDGPRIRFALAADRLTQSRIVASLPPSVLGPLLDLSVRGSFDYRLHLDLDLSRPDSVDFSADVIPHDLRLDPVATRLHLLGLDQPFTAAIHLPHDRIVYRDLSPANPYYRPLDAIDSVLALAVVTNEDGGFFRHRGFNVEAIKSATAENLKAGAFRRGAGTITMQLARNLYLGHRRTLARKAQEVVLAWVLEHLTGLTKRRLLEIYLNIIEWGPGVHGAAEATHYYFDRDPRSVPVADALFLTTVVPAPTRWRGRLDAAGGLRRFERAQMHFIGRAMVAKGWLPPDSLPPADSLRIELGGTARSVVFPADTLHVEAPKRIL